MSLRGCVVTAFLLLVAPFCDSAQAFDYQIGQSLVCDTQQQVERFVALFTGDAQAAIRFVNAEEKNPAACAIMNVAFLRGAQVGTARHGASAFGIIRILVVGIDNGNGVRPCPPSRPFLHISRQGICRLVGLAMNNRLRGPPARASRGTGIGSVCGDHRIK
jgi:hypothetical protein